MIQERTNFTDKDLQAIFADSEAASLQTVDQFSDEFKKALSNRGKQWGYTLPWSDTHELVRIRPGEVSGWVGINGHGKSSVASYILTHLTQQCKVGICSFEFSPAETAAMMAMQAAAVDDVATDYADRFAEYIEDKCVWYDVIGNVSPLEAIGAIVAMARWGAKVILVDSLQFCGVTDDLEREKLFMNQLVGLARALDIHIMLVHHVRKPPQGGDEYIPTRFDVKGSGSIVDQVQLLMIIWENKLKRSARQKLDLNAPLSDRETDALNKPCSQMIVTKQRNGTFEGAIGLWSDAGRTFKRPERAPKRFLEI